MISDPLQSAIWFSDIMKPTDKAVTGDAVTYMFSEFFFFWLATIAIEHALTTPALQTKLGLIVDVKACFLCQPPRRRTLLSLTAVFRLLRLLLYSEARVSPTVDRHH